MFDALRRAESLSLELERPGARRLVRVGAAGAFGNALTVYVPGCNLACVHCWAGPEREDPLGCSRWWSYAELRACILRHRRHSRLPASARHLRISGGEAVLGPGVVEFVEALLRLPGRVSLETNGVVFGAQPAVLAALARFGDRLHINMSIKAGTAEQFERITGARAAAWETAWAGLERLRGAGLSFELNALSLAPELFGPEERAGMLLRLDAIDPDLRERLSEEGLSDYPETRRRMGRRALTSAKECC